MSEGSRVLVVEDDPNLLKLLEMYLSRLGYEVDSYSGTVEAWEAVEGRAGSYRAALVDLSTPGMSGDEFARRLLERHPRVAVVVMSGYAADVERLETEAPGRVVFLHKPFTAAMLLDALDRLLRA